MKLLGIPRQRTFSNDCILTNMSYPEIPKQRTFSNDCILTNMSFPEISTGILQWFLRDFLQWSLGAFRNPTKDSFTNFYRIFFSMMLTPILFVGLLGCIFGLFWSLSRTYWSILPGFYPGISKIFSEIHQGFLIDFSSNFFLKKIIIFFCFFNNVYFKNSFYDC